MKNMTQNSTSINDVQSTNGKDFIKRTFMLLSFLTFLCFGSLVKAQNSDVNVSSFAAASGCTYTVEVFSGANLLWSQTTFTTGVTNSGCVGSGLIVTHIVVTETANCSSTPITFNATLGVIAYSSVNPGCTTCGSTAVTCAGGSSGGGPCTLNYLVELK
jgi:hypothetical protein